MFTGIVESLGTVSNIVHDDKNLHLTIKSAFTNELKIDQSVAHNGICLTVTSIKDEQYVVTAIHETILKTNIGSWKQTDAINLERGMKLGDRLDGHIVQGHVDEIATCIAIENASGSWYYTFEYASNSNNLTIEKGSITINGVSLTVVNSEEYKFSVGIIPYTYENTTFKYLKIGDQVNLEFDVIGKYVARLHKR